MRTALGLLTILAAFTSTSVADDEALERLDTRTRCVVLFRECLLHIADKDVEAVFRNIADGGSGRSFRINKTLKALSPDVKRELEDREKFFEHNFRHSSEITQSFDKILFSPLKTEKQPVTARNVEDGSNQQGKLHVITIKIPEIEDRRFTTLRFIEVAGKLYWVPFGWWSNAI